MSKHNYGWDKAEVMAKIAFYKTSTVLTNTEIVSAITERFPVSLRTAQKYVKEFVDSKTTGKRKVTAKTVKSHKPTDKDTSSITGIEEVFGLLGDFIQGFVEAISVGSVIQKAPATRTISQIHLDNAARNILNTAIEEHGAWVHPKINEKWAPVTGACISDLKHRVKAEVGVDNWADITAAKTVAGLSFLNGLFNGSSPVISDALVRILSLVTPTTQTTTATNGQTTEAHQ